ncbi:hypothetical protein NDU88_004539 [Pleurodeles waltl]|uniref:Uncharacterized protein n=1 Tax=Pleurodeles waltl TaxID=8319 RepID=A0AAV7TRJ9_PLEWA|nr:hypothetical protein NDU88_004539 [Pleurodeles waltl]
MHRRLAFYESVEARRCGCACSSSHVAEKPFKGLTLETAGTPPPDYLRSSCRRDETIQSQNTGSPLSGLLRFSCHRDFSLYISGLVKLYQESGYRKRHRKVKKICGFWVGGSA